MQYPNILRAVFSKAWAMRDVEFFAMIEIVEQRVNVGPWVEAERDRRIETARAARPARAGSSSPAGGVAEIPIHGSIFPRASAMDLSGGGVSLEDLQAQLRGAASDPSVSAIVLNVDSPGGTHDLVPETAALIRKVDALKPVTAVANTMIGSAAYWLASQASEIVATPSGSLGSVGVFAVHEDASAYYDAKGLKLSVISAGKYKTELADVGPLTDEARGYVQGMVDEVYGMFTGDVARGRSVSVKDVRGETFGEGRMMFAPKAVENGLADRVDTLDGAIRGAFQRAQERETGLAAGGVVGDRARAALLGEIGVEHVRPRIEIARASSAAAPYKPDPYQADPEDTVKCPACAKMNEPDAKYCDQCGAKLPTPTEPYSADAGDTVKCPSCGKMNDTDAAYCDQCGVELAGRTDVQQGGGQSTGGASTEYVPGAEALLTHAAVRAAVQDPSDIHVRKGSA